MGSSLTGGILALALLMLPTSTDSHLGEGLDLGDSQIKQLFCLLSAGE